MTIWQWLLHCQDNFFDNDNGRKCFLPNSFYDFSAQNEKKNIEFLDELPKKEFLVIVIVIVIVMTIITWQLKTVI